MTVEPGRVRWRCRRALLELDLVLQRFVERHFDALDNDELMALDELLLCEDHDLWGMVNGAMPCEQPRWRRLIALMHQP